MSSNRTVIINILFLMGAFMASMVMGLAAQAYDITDLRQKAEVAMAQDNPATALQYERQARDQLVKELDQQNKRVLSLTTTILDKRSPLPLFVTKDGMPSEHVVELMKLDGIYEEGDTFAKALQKTQKTWLVAGTASATKKEYPDIKDDDAQKALQDKVQAVAERMTLYAPRKPLLANYEYAAWQGAFLDAVRARLLTIVQAWKEGTRFDTLVVFTGERDLQKAPGKPDDVLKLQDEKASPLPFKPGWKLPKDAPYETEHDMMKLVFDQVQLPEDMAKALEGKVIFINAKKGSKTRVTTQDTIDAWINEYNPKPGAVLSVSSSFFWPYQHLASVRVLGKNFPVDTISGGLTPEGLEKRRANLVSTVHDTVTKALHEINLMNPLAPQN